MNKFYHLIYYLQLFKTQTLGVIQHVLRPFQMGDGCEIIARHLYDNDITWILIRIVPETG